MRPGADSATTRNGKSTILAYDHGLEHGPFDVDPVPEAADPEVRPTSVAMSGGSKTSDRDFPQTVESATNAGAEGLAVGRNASQRDDPEGILDALERVVSEEATTDEALETAGL